MLGVDGGGERVRVRQLEPGADPDRRRPPGQRHVDDDRLDREVTDHVVDVVTLLLAGLDRADQDLAVVHRADQPARARGKRVAHDRDGIAVMGVGGVEETDQNIGIEDDYRHPSRTSSR
jgi:hypothetical protein